MPSHYIYSKGDEAENIASMRGYATRKQEIDKMLSYLIEPYIKDKTLRLLDAACGIGHLSAILGEMSPTSTFFGVDQTAAFVEEAKKLYASNAQASFRVMDVEDMPIEFSKAFDVTVCRGVISWIPYYEEFMTALMAVTKDHIFVSSLFYDGDIDFEIRVREFQKEGARDGFNKFYNVYSFSRFKKFLLASGARDVVPFDFNIGIELPRGSADSMGTYTVKLDTGELLQISGSNLHKSIGTLNFG